MVNIAKKSRVKRFIYASSSSVYGIKNTPEVTEDIPLGPLTDYSRYKAECEKILLASATEDFAVTIIRPATVCGYSPRLRLDLTVNILANHAVNKGSITVFGGEQLRPNIHIEDMTDLYSYLLELPDERIHKKIYNAGCENYTIREIAQMVKTVVDKDIPIDFVPIDDKRSYHVSSKRIKEDLGFFPTHTVKDAVEDLKKAFESGLVPNPLTDIRYYNLQTLKALKLK